MLMSNFKETRMKKFSKVALVLLVAVMFLFTGISDLMARGGSRSSSSRSSSSRSSSRSSRPTKSTSSRSARSAPKKTTVKSTKPKSSKRTVAKPKRSAAQQKSFEASKKNGTSKMTKAQSMNKFKSDKAMQKKYTSSYASKPVTRPSHVPTSTRGPNGTSYNVTYNQSHGGYGYTNALGAYIMYDMMSDSIMRNRMMSRSGYSYIGDTSMNGTVVVHRSSGHALLWVLLGLGVLVVVIVVVSQVSKS